MKSYSITIINERDIRTTLEFVPHAYPNLMEFIVNELFEEIGDCRGRAWCGTCHGVIVQGIFEPEEIVGDEVHTLEILSREPQSRLACQVMMEPKLDGMVFEIVGDN